MLTGRMPFRTGVGAVVAVEEVLEARSIAREQDRDLQPSGIAHAWILVIRLLSAWLGWAWFGLAWQ